MGFSPWPYIFSMGSPFRVCPWPLQLSLSVSKKEGRPVPKAKKAEMAKADLLFFSHFG
jgi:hypothetical protein